MPDFAKALEQLRSASPPQVETPAAEVCPAAPDTFGIRSQLQYLRSRVVYEPVESGNPTILPDGVIESTPFGSHYVVRTSYEGDHYHGRVRLNRFSAAELQTLMTVMRQRASISDRDRVIFLDTETTGVQGGTGTCPFMVGVGYFDGDEFRLAQYFIRDFDEEPSMLFALRELLRQFELVVTYNGASFDIPLLETRFTLSRLESPFPVMGHFDLLNAARRLWRNGHGSCRLTALERELLSFLRGPDVPGAMIPRVYFDYLHGRQSPSLPGVFKHNIFDIVSLAALTLHACDRITAEPAPLDDPLDLFSLARVLENSSQWERCRELYEMAIAGGLPEGFRARALEYLMVICRRAGEHEESLRLCRELMVGRSFSLLAYEGAAIYYERVAGDLDAALQVIGEALKRIEQTPEKKRWKILLRARWERLHRRILQPVIGDFVNNSTT